MRRLVVLPFVSLLLVSCLSVEKTGARVSQILIGSALNAREEITEEKTDFAASQRTLYAHVFLEGHTGSVVVTGAWWYVPREQKIFETTATVTPEFPVAKFSLSNNRGDWPVGDYRFTVDAAGEQLGEKVITVAREEK